MDLRDNITTKIKKNARALAYMKKFLYLCTLFCGKSELKDDKENNIYNENK